MFDNLTVYPIESPMLQWESKVVVRDQEREARLYVRLQLTGTSFPVFNSTPFVQVGKVRARFVGIADDGLSVNAYFDTALPNEGAVEFGYDDQVLLRFPRAYDSGQVLRLDPSRLPRNLQYQDALLDSPRPVSDRPEGGEVPR